MTSRRIGPTESALLILAGLLTRIPGHKNLMWISGGCSIGAEAAARFSAANVTVYAIDAHGVADVSLRPEDHVARDPFVYPEEAQFPRDPGFLAKVSDFAELTGGAAITGSNDLPSQLRKAANEGRGGYVLGFQPDSRRWDGTFHALKLTVNRRRLKVQTRMGYLAVDSVPDVAEQLRLAAESPEDATAIPMEVSTSHLPVPSQIIMTRVHVGGGVVAFEEDRGGGAVARLKLVFVQLNAAGQSVGGFEQNLSVELDKAKHEEARSKGLRLSTPISIQNGTTRLRVLLQDVSTGSVGSVTVPL